MEESKEQGENKPQRDEKGRLLPGNTANPNGRPLGSISLKALLIRKLEEVPLGQTKNWATQIIDTMLERAIVHGDGQILRLIMNYVDNMPAQPLSNPDGTNLNVTFASVFNKPDASTSQGTGESPGK